MTKWASVSLILILIFSISFIIFSFPVHALTFNDLINSIISVFTPKPSTGSIQGGVGIGAGGSAVFNCSAMDPNYCNINDDCICSMSKCFRGNKDYAENCAQEVNACQMNYCFFASGEGMICINHVCQIGKTVCIEGSRRCLGNGIEQCINGSWAALTTFCKYGCSDGQCNPEPTTTTTTTPIFCTNDFDCPEKMKCTNYTCPSCPTGAACAPCMPNHCVDVGCVKEGGTTPGGSISPEYRKHMATECCEGLKLIDYAGYYDEKCNHILMVGAPGGTCSKCGNGICESWETKCTCPQDCSNCIKEGDKGSYFRNDTCCGGLLKGTNSFLSNGICIAPTDGSFVCINCGNGVCGPGENKCNCPQDCGGITTTTINFKSGWNLFSIPVKNVFAVSSTNCSPASPIYGYSNGNYYQTTYTTGGSGYWVKMNSDCSETLTGTDVTINDFPTLNAGWNLIGAPSTSTIFTDVVGNCNVVSGPYWFNPSTNSYVQSSTLDPSKGYFVKVSASCQLGAGLPPSPPQ